MKKLKILALLSSLTLSACVFDTGPSVATPDQVAEFGVNNTNNTNNINNLNNTNNVNTNNTNNTNNTISPDCALTPLAASSAARSDIDYDLAPYPGGLVLSWAEGNDPTVLRSLRWTFEREITVFSDSPATFLAEGEDANFASATVRGDEVLYVGARGDGLAISLCPIDETCDSAPYRPPVSPTNNASLVDLLWSEGSIALIAFGRTLDAQPEQLVASQFDVANRKFSGSRAAIEMTLNGPPSISSFNDDSLSAIMAARSFSAIEVTGHDGNQPLDAVSCELPDQINFVDERVATTTGETRPFALLRGSSEMGPNRTFVGRLECGDRPMAPTAVSAPHESISGWDVTRAGDTPVFVSAWVGDGDLWVSIAGPQMAMSEPFLLDRETDLAQIRIHAIPGRTIITGMTPEDGLVIWQFDGTPIEQAEALSSCLEAAM